MDWNSLLANIVCLFYSETFSIMSYTKQVMFQAYGTKQGALHGLLISTLYPTKDHLKLKRFPTQSSKTTYECSLRYKMQAKQMYKNAQLIIGNVREKLDQLSIFPQYL